MKNKTRTAADFDIGDDVYHDEDCQPPSDGSKFRTVNLGVVVDFSIENDTLTYAVRGTDGSSVEKTKPASEMHYVSRLKSFSVRKVNRP